MVKAPMVTVERLIRGVVGGVFVLVVIASACANFEGKPMGTGTGGTTATGGVTAASGGSTGTGGSTMTGGGGSPATGGRLGTGGAPGTGGAANGSGGTTGTVITRVDLKGKKVLLIVDNPAELADPTTPEAQLRDDLVIGKEMVVTVSDTAAVHPNAATMNLIIASSSASATEFPALYKAVAVPMILFGNTTYQAMGIIAASSGKGTASTPVMLTIVTGATPLASALGMGTNFSAIGTDRSTSVYWGTPGGSPINVAAVAGAPAQSCVFAYEKGSAMAAGTAPARRVGLAWKVDVIQDLSIESFRLMNAAIEWTAAAPP